MGILWVWIIVGVLWMVLSSADSGQGGRVANATSLLLGMLLLGGIATGIVVLATGNG